MKITRMKKVVSTFSRQIWNNDTFPFNSPLMLTFHFLTINISSLPHLTYLSSIYDYVHLYRQINKKDMGIFISQSGYFSSQDLIVVISNNEDPITKGRKTFVNKPIYKKKKNLKYSNQCNYEKAPCQILFKALLSNYEK